MTDRFKVLRTYEEATPGPWEAEDAGGGAFDVAAIFAENIPEEDARHIATWDPDLCREVVGLGALLKRAGGQDGG